MNKEVGICLALDNMSAENALRLTREVGRRCYAVKIHSLYHAEGGSIVGKLRNAGAPRVWVDVKLHDTPETVAESMTRLNHHGVHIVTVHAAGMLGMMQAAVNHLVLSSGPRTAVWAVTMLTSISQNDVERDCGTLKTIRDIVLGRALMARDAGLGGIVCSPQEIHMLAKHPDLKGMALAVTGIRPPDMDVGGHKRVGTLRQTIEDGATHVVIGREITEAEDPVEAFDALVATIN